MAVIRSMWTDIPAHDVAQRFMNTGSLQLPKPSMGSWVVYGLGTENQNMPGFITLGGNPEWRQSSFLPGIYQGCNVNYAQKMSLDEVLLNIRSQFSPLDRQRRQLDFVHELNKQHAAALQKDAQLEARIESFEIAFKMQTEATDAFDISKEPQEVKDLYGATEMGAKMLVARRLVERGVRFVQVAAGGWDNHDDVANAVPRAADEGRQPRSPASSPISSSAACSITPSSSGVANSAAPSSATAMAMALRAAITMAVASAPGWPAAASRAAWPTARPTSSARRAVENKVHPHDLHATILALMGFDHTKLTYRYNGRDFRLTDNFGNVVKDIIA